MSMATCKYVMFMQASGIFLLFSAGVTFMHDCGYVHQDLKSSNVLIFGDRTVKVCDFGLARKKPDTMMLVDRELCTLWYRAPELLMCESMYSHKIDEWSVGCMMLEMVIGSPPFRGKPECTCQCPQVTHRNFNSDQLARIFLVTGMYHSHPCISALTTRPEPMIPGAFCTWCSCSHLLSLMSHDLARKR